MDIDEDDDFYAPEEPTPAPTEATALNENTGDGDSGGSGDDGAQAASSSPKAEKKSEELEEGEEEDEGGAMDEDEDESDIDIITERKDGTKAAPPTQSRYSDIRNIPQRSASNDMTVKAAPAKKEEDDSSRVSPSDLPLGVPSADKAAAAASKSTIDVNANPAYPPAGKPITAVNIDEDLPENEKPWRKPGTDISDYFNYGFDEFTWALYAAKQEAIRGEYSGDAFAAGQKKMMEDFGMMMMGGMSMPGAGPQGGGTPQQPGGGAGGMPGMPGMDGMPPDMQAMMQQMMSQGMDPSQMDPSAMSAMFSGMQGQGGNAGGGAGQGQNFGQGGFGGNQGQYGGYDQQGMGGGRGGFGGRGRGGRRQW
ncbi:Pre-mRNA polyadenylation factor FIP1 [Colletotrichum sidae]|uniref:Pre-mRNA polyadenylation factor FIP1 n=3 Tax=Colletotrichum orbiculare species complex TaxID=2707354 RepID=N4V5M7_COLOR|nr:Pre-mRNA polyadenylation factor FIP1 [Colletotrichum orbiculare MAFF 240422]TDZ49710.1 Pre-mRNA polyadenylation factor FIP1 [Colletotrichum trifolii]TEA18099.1 Pre-mRNA polyadenylation factor FIP1 [Colletotrichum sidae]